MAKIINGIELKEAETNFERAILGLIDEEAKKLRYGRVTIDIIVHNSKITHIDSYTTKRSLSVNGIS